MSRWEISPGALIDLPRLLISWDLLTPGGQPAKFSGVKQVQLLQLLVGPTMVKRRAGDRHDGGGRRLPGGLHLLHAHGGGAGLAGGRPGKGGPNMLFLFPNHSSQENFSCA
jgi:hypothetical protein